MAEGGGLLNRYTGLYLYRGFESPRLRSGQWATGNGQRVLHPTCAQAVGDENVFTTLAFGADPDAVTLGREQY